MKNFIIKKGLCLLLVVLGLAACDEDIHNFTKTTASEASNNIFIADSIFTYSVFWDLEGEFTATMDTVTAKFPVSLAKPSETDVVVTLKTDSSLIAAYNMRYGTNYGIALPQEVETSDMTVTIPAGQTVSVDSISVTYTRPKTSLTRIGGYLIPIKIASYKGADVKIAYDKRHCYLAVDVVRENEVYFDGGDTFTSVNAVEQDLNEMSFALKSRYVIQGKEDAKVKVSVNNNLIAAFNAEQGADYQPIPSGLTTSYEVTMSKGSSDAATFKLEYTGDVSALDDSKEYVIPLEISSVSGDAAIHVMESDKVFYLIVSVFAAPKPTTSTVVATEAEIGGTKVADKSKYVLVSHSFVDGSAAVGMFGNSPVLLNFPKEGGYYNISAAMPGMESFGGGMIKKVKMTIDLGVEYRNITGLYLQNNPGAPDGYAGSIESLDIGFGTEKTYGMGMSAVVAGTISTSKRPRDLYIKFAQPITARYIMLDNIANGNMAAGAANVFRLNSFNIYTQP
jgi:hypothetical protein